AWFISFIRFPLLIAALLCFAVILRLLNIDVIFPFLPDMSAIYFTFVNILCYYILHRILKKEGSSFKDLLGYRKDRIGKDVLLGFLWLFVLYIPFSLGVIGTMFVMYGADFVSHFETVFVGDIANTNLTRPYWFLWVTALIALIFPFLNAPIEEFMYRGYAQPAFIKHYKKAWLGILIPAVGFALQHIMLSASIQGAVVYAVAFFAWGIGSGIIYHKQQRLFPLIICHFIVNIAFSIIPIIFLLMGVYR
ncbi:MAG TPA: CPBP family intramembrane glutamic endopeptidase, partial [Bacillaceae bacterium]|nr:CPBP family intramembrane glutamic endopeptidase [Bacillaceae bacterium]